MLLKIQSNLESNYKMHSLMLLYISFNLVFFFLSIFVQLGDMNGIIYNRQPYSDYTNYQPVNTAYEVSKYLAKALFDVSQMLIEVV